MAVRSKSMAMEAPSLLVTTAVALMSPGPGERRRYFIDISTPKLSRSGGRPATMLAVATGATFGPSRGVCQRNDAETSPPCTASRAPRPNSDTT